MDELQIKIKNKDLKLGEYRISLEDFAKSLSGYSNVLSIVGTYSVSGRIEEKPENWIVDVVTDAKLAPGSIEIIAIISAISQAAQPIGETINSIRELFNAMCSFIFSKRSDSDSQNAVNAILNYSIESQKITADTAKHAIDKIAEITKMYSRNALNPIGKSCGEIDLIQPATNLQEKDKLIATVDNEVKKVISKNEQPVVSQIMEFDIILCSLNKISNKCTFIKAEDCPNNNYYENDNESFIKHNAVISDDAFSLPSNVYTTAFNTGEILRVQAKLKTTAKNKIYNIYDAHTLKDYNL